jgi:hypothetical protein
MRRILNLLGITIALILLVLTSCSTEKKLQKAINKHGQKESVGYIVNKYPEYFTSFSTVDTVTIKDTVLIPTSELDTLFIIDEQDGTYVAENEALKLEVIKLNDKLKVKGTVKPKTITIEKEVPVIVNKPCPDSFLQKDTIQALTLKLSNNKVKLKNYLIIIIILIITNLIGWYLVYRKRQGIL